MTALALVEQLDDIAKSEQIVACAGYTIIPIKYPLWDVWHVVGVNASSLLILVNVISSPEWPQVTPGFRYSIPPGWPPSVKRLIHKWGDGPLPACMGL